MRVGVRVGVRVGLRVRVRVRLEAVGVRLRDDVVELAHLRLEVLDGRLGGLVAPLDAHEVVLERVLLLVRLGWG